MDREERHEPNPPKHVRMSRRYPPRRLKVNQKDTGIVRFGLVPARERVR